MRTVIIEGLRNCEPTGYFDEAELSACWAYTGFICTGPDPLFTVTPTPSSPTPTPTLTFTPTITPTPTPTACSTYAIQPPITPYKQTSQPWESETYDDESNIVTHNIGHKGCLETCLAMISEGEYNPGTINALFKEKGFGNGTEDAFKHYSHNLVYSRVATLFGWLINSFSYSQSNLENDLEAVPQEIVIARVTDSTGNNHFVLVTGEKWNGTQCDFTISDPGFSKTFLSQYPTPSELVVIQRSGGLN